MPLSVSGAIVVSMCCFMNTQHGIIREVSPVKDGEQVSIVQSNIMDRDNEILVNEDMISQFQRVRRVCGYRGRLGRVRCRLLPHLSSGIYFYI